MKKKHNTQRNHLIFYLANKEKQFKVWRQHKWNRTKFFYDAIFGIFDFYAEKANKFLGDGLKNPLVLQQINEFKAHKIIFQLRRLKHIKLTQRNKRNKLIYAPQASKDISFNQNLVSKFGTAE
jgi:hypothetical protein